MSRKKRKDLAGLTLRCEMMNHKVMPVGTWYWVNIGRYWLVLGGTGSVKVDSRSAWHVLGNTGSV